jgi:hypothetical protein
MRFNHMELTLGRGELDDRTREDVRAFYGDVLGWKASTVRLLGQDGLLLQVDEAVSQFLLLMESDDPIRSPGYDHLGLLLETREEVDAVRERCLAFRERDARVRIKDYDDLEQGAVTVHAFYVKYLLPIWFDVQCMEWQPGTEPRQRWSFG